MALNLEDKSIGEVESVYKDLVQRRDILIQNKYKVEVELNARKRALKEAIDECKKAGFNPDNLIEDIKKTKEVLLTKMEVFSADLSEAENMMKPMLKEIG